MRDRDQTSGTSQGRTDRLVTADLEIPKVDGYPGPIVHHSPSGPHWRARAGGQYRLGRQMLLGPPSAAVIKVLLPRVVHGFLGAVQCGNPDHHEIRVPGQAGLAVL